MTDRALLLAAGLVAWICAGCGPRPSGGPPNFVLCMADDQGWGDVGYRDHPVLQTPTLDAMAARGLRLERFYAAAPTCSPTRGSVLTGRHPNRFGCFSWGYTLRAEETTLAEILRDAGYATGHFGKWHLGPVEADSPLSPGASGFDEWLSNVNFFDFDPRMSHNGAPVQKIGESSQVLVEAALEFIRAASERRQPFLALVWFAAPHRPHEALPEDLAPYADQPERKRPFYAELTALDRALGDLRRGLRELGIERETLLWYTSDNGALRVGSTGGLSGEKGLLQEGGVRVPAILEWPSRIGARVSELPCSTVDILPTLLALAGVEPPDPARPMDGQSLVALLDGHVSERAAPLGFWLYPAEGQHSGGEENAALEPAAAPPQGPFPPDEFPGDAAWIDGAYKLHRRATETPDTLQYQLFDLTRDPAEATDLASREPERVARMGAALQSWQESVLRSLNGEDDAR